MKPIFTEEFQNFKILGEFLCVWGKLVILIHGIVLHHRVKELSPTRVPRIVSGSEVG
jgi:hypothetical protein